MVSEQHKAVLSDFPNTPEQWDLVPAMPTRKVDRASNTIEVGVKV